MYSNKCGRPVGRKSASNIFHNLELLLGEQIISPPSCVMPHPNFLFFLKQIIETLCRESHKLLQIFGLTLKDVNGSAVIFGIFLSLRYMSEDTPIVNIMNRGEGNESFIWCFMFSWTSWPPMFPFTLSNTACREGAGTILDTEKHQTLGSTAPSWNSSGHSKKKKN